MRVVRRTSASSSRAAAEATSPISPMAKPEPMMNSVNQNEPASTTAASSATPYQPSMTVSVTWMADCASRLPTSGSPSARVARACCAMLSGLAIRPA